MSEPTRADDAFERWRRRHPTAEWGSLRDIFTAGYLAGVADVARDMAPHPTATGAPPGADLETRLHHAETKLAIANDNQAAFEGRLRALEEKLTRCAAPADLVAVTDIPVRG